jgi:CRP-like cAMP-binding protein
MSWHDEPTASRAVYRQAPSAPLADRYPGHAAELLNPLLDMLGRSREAFNGDLDIFLIVLVILARTVQHPQFRKLSQQALLNGEVAVLPSLRTNIRSIAASVGVPRESVRRKLGMLVSRGWVVRSGRDLFIDAEAYRRLVAVHEGMEKLAVRYADVVSAAR